jgi:hypothetical protein
MNVKIRDFLEDSQNELIADCKVVLQFEIISDPSRMGLGRDAPRAIRARARTKKAMR